LCFSASVSSIVCGTDSEEKFGGDVSNPTIVIQALNTAGPADESWQTAADLDFKRNGNDHLECSGQFLLSGNTYTVSGHADVHSPGASVSFIIKHDGELVARAGLCVYSNSQVELMLGKHLMANTVMYKRPGAS
jgi:hypothetical protein